MTINCFIISYSSGNKSIGNRGLNYGVDGYEIDGNDVFEIHETIKLAIKNLCII